jgi:hypothetical protein
MKSISRILLAASILFAACNKDTTETGIDAVNDVDRSVGASSSRLYLTNIALSHVVFDHSTDTTVIRLAEDMILLNLGAYNELIEIGRIKSMSIPDRMNDEQEALENSLKALSGHVLDSTYLQFLLQQQHHLLQGYETLSSSGNNLTLKDHAERYHDTLNTYHSYTDSLAEFY